MNDILNIKIVRDFNKIYYQSNPLSKVSILTQIKSTFNPTYLNLLELIRNEWLQKVMIPTKKFSISDLKNIDIDFLYNLSFYDNIKVAETPLFYHLYLENTGPNTSEIKTKIATVEEIRHIDTENFIKSHPYDTFYIYIIKRTHARWKQLKDDKGIKRYERKLKLEQLKKVEIEL